MENMIELINLTKKFGDKTVVDALNLNIKSGEFFGLLGPNGAGKTTTVSMLSTVLIPTSGEILIDGRTLDRRSLELKKKISVVTQEYSMRLDMTMNEIMEYQGRLYHMSVKKIRIKTDELFEASGLLEHRHKAVRKLSGGLKRKLMVCRALLTEPEIMLLDEPTAGMDVMGRNDMWETLKKLNESGMTIVLTTHYMEEAEKLCDRVGMMDKGCLIRLGAPDELINGEKNLEQFFLNLYRDKER